MTISSADLIELTKRINERLGEFSMTLMPNITKGIVRVAYQVITEWQGDVVKMPLDDAEDKPFPMGRFVPAICSESSEPEQVYAIPPTSTSAFAGKLTPPDVARTNVANALANDSGALVEAIRKPRTLAEVDGDTAPITDKDKKAELLRAIIYELQDMAVDEVMPTINFWNSARPPHLPSAPNLLAKFDLTWNKLAEYAKLETRVRGQRPKHGGISRAHAEDADGEGEP